MYDFEIFYCQYISMIFNGKHYLFQALNIPWEIFCFLKVYIGIFTNSMFLMFMLVHYLATNAKNSVYSLSSSYTSTWMRVHNYNVCLKCRDISIMSNTNGYALWCMRIRNHLILMAINNLFLFLYTKCKKKIGVMRKRIILIFVKMQRINM